jgi:hypothetical protein
MAFVVLTAGIPLCVAKSLQVEITVPGVYQGMMKMASNETVVIRENSDTRLLISNDTWFKPNGYCARVSLIEQNTIRHGDYNQRDMPTICSWPSQRSGMEWGDRRLYITFL